MGEGLPAVNLVEFGAAEKVSGSRLGMSLADLCHILLDNGLSYGPEDKLAPPGWLTKLDFVQASHGHADHCALMRIMANMQGYHAPIGMIQATPELVEMQNREFMGGKDRDLKRAAQELDILMEWIQKGCGTGWKYGEAHQLLPGVAVTGFDAGHIIGSAQFRYDFSLGGREMSLLTAFDLGRTDYKLLNHSVADIPFVRFPFNDFSKIAKPIDYIVMEATYGSRVHTPLSDSLGILEQCVDEIARGEGSYAPGEGTLLIPVFSIQRSQMLLKFLYNLKKQGKLQDVPVYVVSPSIQQVKEIMLDHAPEMDESSQKELRQRGENSFDFTGLNWSTKTADYRSLYSSKKKRIVLASSGMCDMGNVVNFLTGANGYGVKVNPYPVLESSKNIVLLTGYQDVRSTGNQLQQIGGEQDNGHYIPRKVGQNMVRARIRVMHGLSGHADGPENVEHLKRIRDVREHGYPLGIYIKHGEARQCEELRQLIIQAGYPHDTVHVMKAGQVYQLPFPERNL